MSYQLSIDYLDSVKNGYKTNPPSSNVSVIGRVMSGGGVKPKHKCNFQYPVISKYSCKHTESE